MWILAKLEMSKQTNTFDMDQRKGPESRFIKVSALCSAVNRFGFESQIIEYRIHLLNKQGPFLATSL